MTFNRGSTTRYVRFILSEPRSLISILIQLPAVFGGRMGSDCRNEDELEKALSDKSNGFRFIEAHTDRWDGSPGTASRCPLLLSVNLCAQL